MPTWVTSCSLSQSRNSSKSGVMVPNVRTSRRARLPPSLGMINPNTRTHPVFRSSAGAELTKRIYARVPVLIEEARGAPGNPWGIKFMRALDMADDTHLFRTSSQLVEAGAQRVGPNWVLPSGDCLLPVVEAKMFDIF